MSSQERILIIFIRLLQGNKLSKIDLMEEFHKNSSTIQRDIAIIDELLHKLNSSLPASKFSPFKNLGELDRSHRGYYQLTDFSQSSYMDDYELFMIFKVLFASRGFHENELKTIYYKLFANVSNQYTMDRLLSNERFYYEGVPKQDLYPTIKLLLNAMLNQQKVEFSYTKNGETKIFKRVPMDIYFSDLYFFMISAKHTTKDDTDFDALNKFRINNMTHITVLNEHESVEYANRFQGGVLRNQTALPFFGEPITLVIDFFYEPAYVLDRFPNSVVKRVNSDGSHRIEIPANNGYGVKMWLLEQGAHVKVISPKYIQNYLIDNMKKTLSYYDISINEEKPNLSQ